jgi:predicted phage baseplate assembly protein
MSRPWWGKDVDRAAAIRATDDVTILDADRLAPLTELEPEAIVAELVARRAGFTPTWTSQRNDDPGSALQAVYAAQHAQIADAIDDLPTKARVEHLRALGLVRNAPRALSTMLVFEVSPAAPGGVLVGERFEVLGRDAIGTSVSFETDRALFAVPAKLAVVGRRSGGSVGTVTIPTAEAPGKVYPFGLAPKPGVAVYLGLDSPVVPSPQLAIGVFLASTRGEPPAVSAGGLFPRPGAEPPRLAWELFDGRRFVAAEVIRDETKSFMQSGVVELRIPTGLRAGTPPGADDGPPLYWVRCVLLAGEWSEPPVIGFVALNVVPAQSGRTIRSEIVETPVSVDPASRRTLTLAENPVLDGTLVVEIDEGGPQRETWLPVDDLSQVAPDERKFRFDPVSGTLFFGDGRNGRPLPEGFRHVRATYRVASQAGSIPAGAISTLVGAAPFLQSVTNPHPASGGAEPETLEAALLRGPREIRARNRAVAAADYEVLARRAPGADIRRARAVGGLHPRFLGAPQPGVVGVFVVGALRDDGQPPVPTEATLHAVTEYLSTWAPRGAEVIAVAPKFHSIRVEASFELDTKVDVTEIIHDVSRALDRWFDPVVGSANGEGWPFGGTIFYDALIRFLLRDLGGSVIAIPSLLLVVDGVRSRHCADVVIPEYGLLWPAPHQLVPLPRRSR